MSELGSEQLYRLLPAIHRMRDAAMGSPLRALLAVIEAQAAAIEQDIDRLYDNWFIETCDDQVVPYIGDLLAVRGLHPISSSNFTQRAYVANTLAYRRRKGTRAVIEKLAQDATGWPAVAVEGFRLLGTTQFMNHLRPANLQSPDLRDTNELELLGTAFESASRTVEVRSAARGGKYNIQDIGIYLFRLERVEFDFVLTAPMAAAEVAAPNNKGLFRFNPLGCDTRLYNERRTGPGIDDPNHESNLPVPLRRRALYDDLRDLRAALLAGRAPEPSYFDVPPFQIVVAGVALKPEELDICDLSDWHRPALPIRAAVDPVLGRIAFEPTASPADVRASYRTAFSARMGGGSYPRANTLSATAGKKVFRVTGGGGALATMLGSWAADPSAAVIIEIGDSLTYAAADVNVPAGRKLEIRAADRQRPLVAAASPAAWKVSLADGAELRLDGLLVSATLGVTSAGEAALALQDAALVPGVALDTKGNPVSKDAKSIDAAVSSGRLTVSLLRAISGRIALPADRDASWFTASDSIIDGTGGAADALQAGKSTLERVTVFGTSTLAVLELGSDCILTGLVTAGFTQEGCCRFTYAADGSKLPRCFRCQPGTALEGLSPAEHAAEVSRLDPSFNSERYGDPGYAQLADCTAEEIRKGASDGSEMGAFQSLHQPQRLANLRAGLDEYLKYGLEAAIFFAT